MWKKEREKENSAFIVIMPLTSALFFPTLAREKILIFSQRQRKIGGGGGSETKKNKNKIFIFIPRARNIWEIVCEKAENAK